MNITNATLVFSNGMLDIDLILSSPVSMFFLYLNNISLSNSPDLNTVCTFNNLVVTTDFFEISDSFSLFLSQSDSDQIITTIGENANNNMPCLVDSNSTYLSVPPNFTVDFGPQTVHSMSVIPDTSPPSLQLSPVTVNLIQGFISIQFTELIDLSTLDISRLTLHGSQATVSNIPLSTLVNSNVMGIARNYNFTLEVYELPIVGAICQIVCSLEFGIGLLVSDIFGNSFIISTAITETATFTSFDPSFYTASLSNFPHNSTQTNVTINPPAARAGEVLSYLVYVFPTFIYTYNANCDFHLAYIFQLKERSTQWTNISLQDLPPCTTNATDYKCVSTSELNFLTDIFPGYSHDYVIITIYPQIQFNQTDEFIQAPEFYSNLLNFNFEIPSSEFPTSGPGNESQLSSVGNRILVTWVADSSFCNQNQITIIYGEDRFPTQLIDSYINLDRTTCLQQYVYIYASYRSFIAYPEIRINTSQINIPANNCASVRLQGVFENINSPLTPGVDRPVITFHDRTRFPGQISVDFAPLIPSNGYIIDFYNIYLFPAYTLQFNGGSCSNIDSQTTIDDFTFLPTEYYKYAVTINQDFGLTCPPPPGLTLPYNCSSVVAEIQEFSLSVELNIGSTHSSGIIIEAVLRQQGTNFIEKVRSYPINILNYFAFPGQGTAGYQAVEWDISICEPQSFIFIHLKQFIDTDVLRTNSTIAPCSPGRALINPTSFPFSFFLSNFVTEVSTPSGPLCFSGYESAIQDINVENTIQFPHIEEFQYLDYETIQLSIFIDDTFSNAGDILTIPVQALQLNFLENATESCPSGTSELPIYLLDFRFNSTFSDQANLTCENNNNYLCTSVDNMRNIVVKVIPGFSSLIRVVINGTETDFFPGSFNSYSIQDFQFTHVISETQTNTTLIAPNSIKVEWNVGFYCPPNSFISISWFGNNFNGEVPRGLSGSGGIINEDATMPCDIGSYVITNLDYDTFYTIQGSVFHNSTANFFQICPVIYFLFIPISTSPMLRTTEILDLSRIRVTWEPVAGVTTYTLLAYPELYSSTQDVIGDVLNPTNLTITFVSLTNFGQEGGNFGPGNPSTEFFELCLNSSDTLNCSKVTTEFASAIISVIPGYGYALGIAYEVNGQTAISQIGFYDPTSLIRDEIIVSGFNDVYSYFYNNSICVPGVRNVFSYSQPPQFIGDFPVNSCNISEQIVDLVNAFDQSPAAIVLFIFPFTSVLFPGFNQTTDPNIAVLFSPQVSYLPISAVPVITNVTVPSTLNSNTYQVSWVPPPPFNLPQRLDSYVIYAYPRSTSFTLIESSCSNQNGPTVSPLTIRDPSNDLCPPSNRFYFCREYATLTGELPLLTLLDYDFYIEAVYSDGLRTYDLKSSFYVGASQSLSSLNLTHEAAPASITITWNTQASYCSNAELNFIVEDLNSSSTVIPVACSAGNHTAQGLLPLTQYLVIYSLTSNASGIQQGAEGCVRSFNQVDFIFTTSFCSPTDPCGFGLCSEGFPNSSYHCDCFDSFLFDGITCVDIDECSLTPTVCPNGACVNTIGSYTCTCFEGFSMVNGTCEDINECSITPTICPNGDCVNTIGNYTCTCFEGFSMVNGTCEDINECSITPTICPNGDCVNTIGNYTCTCFEGFSMVNGTCEDINECSITPTICPNGDCVNTIGNYTCTCFEGFSMVNGTCEDINECFITPTICPNGDCVNTIGNYTCTCFEGFSMVNGTCEDINECSITPTICPNGACVNTIGNYTCTCFEGFSMVNGTCEDINECSLTPTICPNGACVNTIGNYTCTCFEGFVMVVGTCEDINECSITPTICPNGDCVNTIGNYTCTCFEGFSMVNGTCEDINECFITPTICPNGDCVNTIGNYTCTCFEGFSMVNGTCEDINECSLTPTICPNGACVNTIGNYTCTCFEGFSMVNGTCEDINECSITPTICPNGACVDTIGSYTCTCFEGFVMVVGTCEDINECEIASNCINGNCTNLLPPVRFECTCNSGFEGASCSIPVETPSCPSITEVNTLGDPVTFPVTELETVATVLCSLINIELFGNVTRLCNAEGDWEPVDYTGCQRITFMSIQATTTLSETRVLTAMESEVLSDELVMATNTSNGPLFPGEVFVASQAVNAITQSLNSLSQDANALLESLANVQDNMLEATSNILSEENTGAFESVSESEAEMQIISLIEAIDDIGILIGSVAQENQTREISQPAAALIVTLVNDATEPLVLGSNLSMTAGSGASALAVSIPPSVFQSSSESIAVSVSLFPTLPTLLMNIRVNTTDPNAPDTTGASNTLGSPLVSINLVTPSGVRITQPSEPINITLTLLNETLIINNATLRTDLYCISSQILSQGFTFDNVTLSNPNDVPPGPAICNATHLTHFGILVSVSSIFSFCSPTDPCGFGLCSEGFPNSSYHCDCFDGFRFDGITCVDIDECSLTPTVCPNGACVNTIGSYTCTCFEGFVMVVGTCEDINECEIASNCINGNCTNLLPPVGFECTCNSGFEGASCSIPVETPSCPSITEVNTLGDPVTFPVTELGTEAVVSCSLINIELFGNVTRGCGEEGEWGPVDYTDCQRIIFVSIQATNTMSETRVLTAMESEILSDMLAMATNTSNGPLFPGEVLVASQAVNVITQSLTNLSQDANALRESLANVQDNVVEATSNILSEENSPAFESVSESEAEMQIISLVEAIEDIGILIGSVAQENQTIVVEISRPAAALIVTLVNDATEPLVLGSNLSMTAGPGASALIAARTSVSIPPSVFQSSSESIAVSLSLFPTVQTLLMNIRVNTTDPNAPDTTDASNALGSSLASINLFTSSGVRITQLPDPINLTFALLNDTPIVNNATLRSDLFCVSSQILSQGFNFDYVTLSNPNDVPPGPAICSATHLTHFGVLVSVTTQNLSQAEITALEVLTYITCTASIICLLLSIAAYLFLWFKTRNKQENLFQKDATILHMNFAIALLLALIFFLSSTRGYGHRGWCTAILIIQYYFWMLVFTSSLSIGIYLLIKIFAWSSQRRVWYYLVLLAWTLPLPLIIIVPSITREYIINDAEMVCWFSKEPNFANLSFIIPMIVITLTNLIILIITAVVLFRISKGNRGMVVQMKGVLIASFTLSPILGIPWLFSIAASTPTSAVSFIFTIVLGLQGVLFAILYPLRTPEILEYLRRCNPRKKNSVNKLESSSTATRSSNPPAALKFRVRRADHTKSTTLPTSKTETLTSEHKYEGVKIEDNVAEKEKEEKEEKIPESHYVSSFPEDVQYIRARSKSPPPYESLDEHETRL